MTIAGRRPRVTFPHPPQLVLILRIIPWLGIGDDDGAPGELVLAVVPCPRRRHQPGQAWERSAAGGLTLERIDANTAVLEENWLFFTELLPSLENGIL